MRYWLTLILCWGLGGGCWGLSGEEIVQKVDANMTFGTARFESELRIRVESDIRVKKMVSYAEGRDRSFVEFTDPPRDAGVKYLKIGDQMWLYLPSVEKVIKIAGHMLRQSMMGSDFSYEDALESSELLARYDVKLLSEEAITVTFRRGTEEIKSEHDCYLLELTARVKGVTYYRRRLWVDRATFVPVREELFALSGKKLKEMELGDIARFGGRHYPLYVRLSNLLRRGSSTELVVTRAQFDLKLPAGTFSQRSLKP